MKKLLNLNGVQKLNKTEQKSINGGHATCDVHCSGLSSQADHILCACGCHPKPWTCIDD